MIAKDPELRGIYWRTRDGIREMRVGLQGNWVRYGDFWPNRLASTPERVAMWVALALNPAET